MERCLVTGADGFIGNVLCDRLDKSGVEILRLVHRPDGRPGSITADLGRDPAPSLEHFRPEVVFHLAGRVHEVDDEPESEADHVRVTVDGTRDLLAASVKSGVKSFVFFSTCAVMPAGRPYPLDESVEPNPITAYGRAKLAAENLVTGMNSGGLKTVCLRLPMVYGPGHKGQLPRMIEAIERGWFPPIPDLGGGRSLVHVEDVVGAALLVSRSPDAAGNVYIVAEPKAYTSRELYESILNALGRRPPRWRVPVSLLRTAAVTGDIGERLIGRRLLFDSEALRKLSESAMFSGALIELELGYEPKRSFATSVHELVSLSPQ